MIIGKYIPDNALQVRYIHPYYDTDEDGYRYIANEDEATDVWQLIMDVNRTSKPLYYRRRISEYARDDVRRWNRSINDANRNTSDFTDWYYVRVKKVGRRVLIVHDLAYWMKVYARYKNTVPRNLNVLNAPRLTPSNHNRNLSAHIDEAWQALEESWEMERRRAENDER
jgi:hypothetical protein